MTRKEQWARLYNFPDYYISSWGRVYSLKSNQEIKGYLHKSKGNIYKRVSLNPGNKKFFIHSLVAKYFVRVDFLLRDNPKLIVEHLDTNTLNNNVTNLRWDTQSNNIKYAHKRLVKNIFKEFNCDKN